MGINFPNSPLVGDLWPSPAVAGQGQYTWDGEKWASGSVPASRSSIYAAPFDAMAYSGMQINGSCDVNQEVPGGVTTHAKYVIDGWRLLKVTAGITGLYSSGSVGLPGFNANIAITVQTPIASLAASDLAGLQTVIEGYRIMRLAWGTASAQPITLGFWTAHHRAGTYSVAIGNSAGNRSIVATYTQNAADAWEYKTITVNGDTAGTWLIDNNIGMTVSFGMAVGSTYVAPAANTWYGVNYIAAPGQINAVAATSDVFRITGVVVLPGIEAPSAARSSLIMRPYDQELVTCQRYFRRIPGSGLAGQTQSATGILVTCSYPPLRAAVTLSLAKTSFLASGFEILVNGVWANNPSASISGTGSVSGLVGTISGFSGLTTGPVTFNTYQDTITLDARL